MKDGYGKEYKDNKLIFEGIFIKGMKNGKGKEYNEKGEIIFEGEYFEAEEGQLWILFIKIFKFIYKLYL